MTPYCPFCGAWTTWREACAEPECIEQAGKVYDEAQRMNGERERTYRSNS